MPWFLKFLPGYGYPKGTCANSFIWTWRFFRNNVPCAWHSYLQSLLLPGKVKKGKKIILAKQGLSFWLQKGDKLKHTNKRHRSKKIQFQYVPCSGSHSQLPSGSQGASTTAFLVGFLPASARSMSNFFTARDSKPQNISLDHLPSLTSFNLEKILIYCVVVLINLSYLDECKWTLFMLVSNWIISGTQWSFDTLISKLRFTFLLRKSVEL